MKDTRDTQTIGVGPMQFNCEMARRNGWTEQMITAAAEKMGELSRSFTEKVGITCIHCKAWNPRPKGGWPCEPINTVGLAEMLASLAARMGCSTQVESDARDDLINAIQRHLT